MRRYQCESCLYVDDGFMFVENPKEKDEKDEAVGWACPVCCGVSVVPFEEEKSVDAS